MVKKFFLIFLILTLHIISTQSLGEAREVAKKKEQPQVAGSTQGYFETRNFFDILSEGVKGLLKSDSTEGMLSAPYMDSSDPKNNRFIIPFIPPGYPHGLSFSLDNVYMGDFSSDTLSFTVPDGPGVPSCSGEIILAGLYVLLYICGSDKGIEEYQDWLINDIFQEDGTPVQINGWTFQTKYIEDVHCIFSATAPRRKVSMNQD